MIIRAFLMPLFFHVNILTKLIKYDIVIGRKDDCMDIQNVDINSVKGYYRNAKKHDTKQIKNVAESIRQFGFVQPIVIDKDGIIIIGHCRYEAAKRLRMDKVPCVRAEDLTDEQVQKLRLLDNKLNESEWDKDLLLEDVPLLDWDGFDIDWDLGDLDGSGGAQAVEDNPVEDVETRCKLGDIWQLGVHRLICGDATNMDVIGMLMDGKRADLALTDPPYGINAVSHMDNNGDVRKGKVHGNAKNAIIPQTNEYFPIIGDNTTETAKASYAVLKAYSDNQIIFGGNYFTDFLPVSRCWIVWDKENSGSFADVELAWTSFDKVAKLYRWMWNGLIKKGDRKAELTARVHPTQKPVGMIGEILKDFSKDGASILDTFGGSGSTLIACEQLGRICYMSELSEYYCDTIIQRYENFTGETAIRVKEGGV